MHELKSINSEEDTFEIPDMGMHYCVESPVECERNGQAFFDAIGKEIKINGNVYNVVGGEFFCLNTPIRIGEKIGVVVSIPKENE